MTSKIKYFLKLLFVIQNCKSKKTLAIKKEILSSSYFKNPRCDSKRTYNPNNCQINKEAELAFDGKLSTYQQVNFPNDDLWVDVWREPMINRIDVYFKANAARRTPFQTLTTFDQRKSAEFKIFKIKWKVISIGIFLWLFRTPN